MHPPSNPNTLGVAGGGITALHPGLLSFPFCSDTNQVPWVWKSPAGPCATPHWHPLSPLPHPAAPSPITAASRHPPMSAQQSVNPPGVWYPFLVPSDASSGMFCSKSAHPRQIDPKWAFALGPHCAGAIPKRSQIVFWLRIPFSRDIQPPPPPPVGTF